MIAILLVLAIAAGWRLVRPVAGLGLPARIGAAFLTGAAASTFVLFALSAVGIPWNRWWLIAGFALIAAVPGLPRAEEAPASPPVRRGAAWIADAGIVALVAAHARWVITVPLYEWDFIGIWGLKGRIFAGAAGIDWTFLEHTGSRGDYPLGVPLLFDAVSVLSGDWNETAIGLLYTILGASAIALVRGALHEELGSGWRGSLAALAVAAPSLSLWVGLGDGVLAVYAVAGLMVMRRAVRQADRGQMLLGSLLLGCTGWIKNEGLALIAVTLLVLAIVTFSSGRGRLLRQAWPALLVPVPWIVARTRLDLTTDFTTGDVAGRAIEHLSNPKLFVAAFAYNPPDPRLFWIAAALGLVWRWRMALTREVFLTSVLLVQMSLFVAQAVFTRYDLVTHIVLTWNRLPSQLAPAFAFLCSVLLTGSVRPLPDGQSSEQGVRRT